MPLHKKRYVPCFFQTRFNSSFPEPSYLSLSQSDRLDSIGSSFDVRLFNNKKRYSLRHFVSSVSHRVVVFYRLSPGNLLKIYFVTKLSEFRFAPTQFLSCRTDLTYRLSPRIKETLVFRFYLHLRTLVFTDGLRGGNPTFNSDDEIQCHCIHKVRSHLSRHQ